MSPEAPVPVIKQKRVETRLGGAASVAMLLKALNVDSVFLLGAIGDDESGDGIRSICHANGIEFSPVVMQGQKTTTKMRLLANHTHSQGTSQDHDHTIQNFHTNCSLAHTPWVHRLIACKSWPRRGDLGVILCQSLPAPGITRSIGPILFAIRTTF